MTLHSDADIIARTLVFEGGFQNDPDDTGNYNSAHTLVGTNFGITPLIYERFTGHVPSDTDMRTMSKEMATQIYALIFLAPFDAVTDLELKGELFDFGVACGVPTAARALQQAVGVHQDGIIGPGTAAKLATADRRAVDRALTEIRIERYVSAILQTPAKAKYLREWILRALTVAEI